MLPLRCTHDHEFIAQLDIYSLCLKKIKLQMAENLPIQTTDMKKSLDTIVWLCDIGT